MPAVLDGALHDNSTEPLPGKAVRPPLGSVRRYSHAVMSESDGSVHVSVTCWLSGVAIRPAGLAGAARGLTASLASDSGPFPASFTARILNVYDVPFVSPSTTNDVRDAHDESLDASQMSVHVVPASFVYCHLSIVPSAAAVQVSVTLDAPGVAFRPVGLAGFIGASAQPVAALVPTAFSARSWKAYTSPRVSPVTSSAAAFAQRPAARLTVDAPPAVPP